MAVVTFSYADWSARYPELASSVAEPLAQLYFNEATLYLNNDGCGPVRDPLQLAMILNMLTAHIAALNAPLNGQASSPLVGRINTASEGSVSVGTDLNVPGTASWFAQSKYGLAAWQALAPYRTMHYRRGPASYARGIGGGIFGGFIR